MTFMTQVVEMISKSGNTFGSIYNGSDEFHGNSRTATAFFFVCLFMQCVINAHLVAYQSVDKLLDNT